VICCTSPCVRRMNALEDELDGWFRRSVELENSKGLIRPQDLAGGGLSSRSSRMAESLRFFQYALAALQTSVRRSADPPRTSAAPAEDDEGDPRRFPGAECGDADGV